MNPLWEAAVEQAHEASCMSLLVASSMNTRSEHGANSRK
jgi:hypothetical protein